MQFIGDPEDTIVAPATAPGVSAIAIVRLSGKNAIDIANRIFRGKNLEDQATHTIHFGTVVDPKDNQIIDEVLVSLFRSPNSFTKEDSIEISTHGSQYIVQKIMKVLIGAGARMAQPGEFTKRAFLHARMDLAQAEAGADLIYSDPDSSHLAATRQMRAGVSSAFSQRGAR